VVLTVCLENKSFCLDLVYPLDVEEKVQLFGKEVGNCTKSVKTKLEE